MVAQWKNGLTGANWLRYIARGVLGLVTAFWLVFALLSGAESSGGELSELVHNAPNALPWIGLVLLNVVAWKWELVGGVLVILLGLFYMFFFNALSPVGIVFWLIVMPMVVLGLMFIGAWWLQR
jgi:hypothetical protein